MNKVYEYDVYGQGKKKKHVFRELDTNPTVQDHYDNQ
jgi:hypothetical protein